MLAAAIALIALSGCDKEVEPIPAYLHIQPFEVEVTDPETHGSVSSKITNASVFLRDKTTQATHSIGVVTLPATVPALVTGDQEVVIDPMIRANGNVLYLQIYPFYQRFSADVNLKATEEQSVKPKTSYTENAVFAFIEDFEGEDQLFSIDRDNNEATRIEVSQDDVFEGTYSGKVTLDTANEVFVAATQLVYTLPFDQVGKVFLEVNYKSEVPLEFGVINLDSGGNEYPNFEYIVLPKSTWNKIYFDMTDLVATASFPQFVFAVRAGIPYDNGRPLLTRAEIYLDNLKLIHF
jgi:hypothetical protein